MTGDPRRTLWSVRSSSQSPARRDLEPTLPASAGPGPPRSVVLRLAGNLRTRGGAVQIVDALLSQQLRHRVHVLASPRTSPVVPAHARNVWITDWPNEVA